MREILLFRAFCASMLRMSARIALAACLAGLLTAFPCMAQVCVATASAISFGTVAIGSLTGTRTTGTVFEGCTGGWQTQGNLATCNSIGVGSNSASTSSRTMKLGSSSIAYQLYSDAGYSVAYDFPGADKFNIPYTTAGGGHVTTTTYAQILSSPAGLAAGTYTDTYSTAAQAMADFNTYNTRFPPIQCGPQAIYTSVPIAFAVSVTIAPSCSVSATNLAFGTQGVLNANIDNTATINVQCTGTTGYSVGLAAGGGTGATTSNRSMTGSGGTVKYGLYQNQARSVNWGNNTASPGGDMVGGTGSGLVQALTVYGRVPPQATPHQGSYGDTVQVTVYY